ncbi:ABC transporter permease subunit [Oscillospiraceae bacterium CM]|nr:ABC transporter permease subunit [Oscillospiraceae bacterium CM]
MNIIKRELRAGLKPFIFWIIGLFVLVFIGIVKYQGLSSSGTDMAQFVTVFPRIVRAVMGIVDVNLNTLTGYSVILSYYVLIFVIIYAVHLGAAAVSRESVDKTYEFLFTKPCSRTRILALKLVSAVIFLALFCVFNALFSVMAVATLKSSESVTGQIMAFTVSAFFIGLLFIALAAFMAAATSRAEKGSLYGNLAFLYAFVLGVIYNMLENPGVLKLFSPMSYFTPADLMQSRLDPIYSGLTLFLAVALFTSAFIAFKKKDML